MVMEIDRSLVNEKLLVLFACNGKDDLYKFSFLWCNERHEVVDLLKIRRSIFLDSHRTSVQADK